MRSRIDGCTLTLPGQLPREDYTRVAKAIEAAGGKWNRKAGCHVFPCDVRKTLNIDIDTVDVVNVQQTYQAFYTPIVIANRMVQLADLNPSHTLLEPSAGTGNLIRAAMLAGVKVENITAVEIDESKRDQIPSGVAVVHIDFMQVPRDGAHFDRILMNPPFNQGQDVVHIQRAFEFLKPLGRLVAICANGPRQQEQLQPMADEWVELESGSFKESGTNVNTAMLVMNAI
jgi:predicted RNA methylase